MKLIHKHKWIYEGKVEKGYSIDFYGLFQMTYDFIYVCEKCGKKKVKTGMMLYSDKTYAVPPGHIAD